MFSRISLREFEAFRAVMMTGTTIGASEVLHISQPSISRMIGNLEQLCGSKLFIRAHGRLRPTKEAEMLLHELEVFYGSLTRIDTFIDSMKEQKIGHLRVLATSPMGHGVLPEIVQSFMREYPQTTISIRVVARRDMTESLENQPFDIGLVTFPLQYPPSDSEHLVEVDGVCVFPKKHRLAKKKVVEVADLEGELFLASSPYSMTRMAIDQFLIRENVTCSRRIETHSAFSICNLVASGIGVSIVDPFTATRFKPQGLEIRPLRPQIKYAFGLVFPIRKRRTGLADDFAVHARDTIAKLSQPFLSR